MTALAVLLGVLAMHAVAGGPHTPRGAAHSMTADAVAAAPSGMQDDMAAVSSVLQDVAGSTRTWSAPDIPGPLSPSMAAMCAALLLTVVVLLGAGLLRRVPLLAPDPRAPSPVRTDDRPRRAPPPDLLTLNCVLRT